MPMVSDPAVTPRRPPSFVATAACWICQGRELRRVQREVYALEAYAAQDPELSAYSGSAFWLVRCRCCGFMQPDALPALEGFFRRLYDQHWTEDWIEREFDSHAKDLIFETVLAGLEQRAGRGKGPLLDPRGTGGEPTDRRVRRSPNGSACPPR
jgi:hypothetical protein